MEGQSRGFLGQLFWVLGITVLVASVSRAQIAHSVEPRYKMRGER